MQPGRIASRDEVDLLRDVVASLVQERHTLLEQHADQATLEANLRALCYWRDRFEKRRREERRLRSTTEPRAS
jgi:hypothetical protein